MSVSDEIKALLAIKGKRNIDLADYLDCTLAFEVDDSQKIILDSTDIRK